MRRVRGDLDLPQRTNYRPISALAVRISRGSGIVGAHLGLLTPSTGDTYPRLADGDQGGPRSTVPSEARAGPGVGAHGRDFGRAVSV